MAITLSACGDSGQSQKLPAPPSSLVLPDEYAWGDATASRDDRMARHVTNHFGDRFGQARERHYVAPGIGTLGGLGQWYGARLGDGWKPLDISDAFGPGEHGFGFARNDQAIIVAWLDAEPDGRVPVTVFHYGE